MPLELKSSAFEHNGSIPRKHTCDGEDIAPPLEWHNAPAGTKSFAFIMDDPDAPDPKKPQRTYVHWVMYDIPASVNRMDGKAPPGARSGKNDFGKLEYGGPCPPIGRHRYFHKLYALDTTLGDRGPLTKGALEDAMRGHVLANAELIGTYERGKGGART